MSISYTRHNKASEKYHEVKLWGGGGCTRAYLAHGLNVIIGADHNLDLIRAKEHLDTSNVIDINFSSGITPTISRPTGVTHRMATLIDNINYTKIVMDICQYLDLNTKIKVNSRNCTKHLVKFQNIFQNVFV